MGKGWIKVHRELKDHWIWEQKPFSKGQAWLDLILMANHSPQKWLAGAELIEVQRGQIITSEKKLMLRWGWSKTKVRAFLDLLEKDNMVSKSTDPKKTTLTISQYCDYQDIETAKKPQKNQEETNERPQKDTNNNVKNERIKKMTYTGIDVQKIVDLFNSVRGQMPEVKALSADRKHAIQARVKEFGEATVMDVMKKAGRNNFLNGKTEDGWRASFDWVMKPKNFVKVMEGNYDNRTNGQAQQFIPKYKNLDEFPLAMHIPKKTFGI